MRNFMKFIFGNKSNEFIKVIREFYDIQYIYCENCIRDYNKPCRMIYCENKFICSECNKTINIKYIRDNDFIFDNKELKKYILMNVEESYFKVSCLLLFWRQPKNIAFNNILIHRILLDIIEDNYDTLFQYDPNYLPV